MSNFKTWISAMRLRTLPLAVSGILMGSALAGLSGYDTNFIITLLALLTAICLQILSNLANDYGDFVKGTDNENRLGNMRALQSGNISPQAMRNMIVAFVLLCLISGLSLLAIAFNGHLNVGFVLFFMVGLAAIAAAIKYTVGKSAYGYKGLGDVFVFLFFGPVAVVGVYVLHHQLRWYGIGDAWIFLPATSIGLLSAAVLNTNNIRDIENDAASGKHTIVVHLGVRKARIYHWILVLTAFVCLFVFLSFKSMHVLEYATLLAFIPIFKQAYLVHTTPPSPVYNGYLKKLSLATLFLVVVFMILQTIALGIYTYTAINKVM